MASAPPPYSRHWTNAVAGLSGGFVSSMAMHPLDVITTRFQVSRRVSFLYPLQLPTPTPTPILLELNRPTSSLHLGRWFLGGGGIGGCTEGAWSEEGCDSLFGPCSRTGGNRRGKDPPPFRSGVSGSCVHSFPEAGCCRAGFEDVKEGEQGTSSVFRSLFRLGV